MSADDFSVYQRNTVHKYILQKTNDEIKTKRYTFPPFSDADVEESNFSKAELNILHQQFLICFSFMNTFFKTKNLLNSYSRYRCEPQKIFKETSFLVCSNNFFLNKLFW